MTYLQGFLSRSPQSRQTDAINGDHKGIVVDVRDPWQLKRVRVWCYGIMGDLAGLNVASLPWAEYIPSMRGSSPPELFDRVMITFENGDRDHPLIKGFWQGNPPGGGKLPHTGITGTDLRPESWHNHSLYPESRVVSASGAGNVIHTEDKFVGGSNFASVISMEDTGGKLIKTRSYHLGAKAFSTVTQAPTGTGKMAGITIAPNTPLRDGLTTVSDAVSGSIEMGSQQVYRSMYNDGQKFSVDQLSQAGDTSDDSISVQSTYGVTHQISQGAANLTLCDNNVALNAQDAVSIPLLLTPPKRWD
jgi:hypothetical protein